MLRLGGSSGAAVLGSLAALAVGAAAWALTDGARTRPELGLLTTLPIYWAETFDIGEAIDGEAPQHWARTALERDYRLLPLDTLEGEEGALGRIDFLLLAQPRALSPADNVALDDWVRAGGHALIFADPFLTGGSRFHVGDRRRPQDVILLSPILRRWGLELQFDPGQPDGEHAIPLGGADLPANLAGTLVKVEGSAPSDCALSAGGLVADCAIGTGRALIVADAALLDEGRGGSASELLEAIADRAFER